MIHYKVTGERSNKGWYSLKSILAEELQENPRHAIEKIAGDFYRYHGGHELRWPLTFAVYIQRDTAGLKEICRYAVDLEDDPVFIVADKPGNIRHIIEREKK